MARWPDVPDVYGWLRLDRRGRWWIRETCVDRPNWAEFIGRNYAADDRGAWYFQNGPQRVFAALDATPWVLSLADDGAWHDHTGHAVDSIRGVVIDAEGSLMLETDRGAALVHEDSLPALLPLLRNTAEESLDEALARSLALPDDAETELQLRIGETEQTIKRVDFDAWPARFGFVRQPRPSRAGRG